MMTVTPISLYQLVNSIKNIGGIKKLKHYIINYSVFKVDDKIYFINDCDIFNHINKKHNFIKYCACDNNERNISILKAKNIKFIDLYYFLLYNRKHFNPDTYFEYDYIIINKHLCPLYKNPKLGLIYNNTFTFELYSGSIDFIANEYVKNAYNIKK